MSEGEHADRRAKGSRIEGGHQLHRHVRDATTALVECEVLRLVGVQQVGEPLVGFRDVLDVHMTAELAVVVHRCRHLVVGEPAPAVVVDQRLGTTTKVART